MYAPVEVDIKISPVFVSIGSFASSTRRSPDSQCLPDTAKTFSSSLLFGEILNNLCSLPYNAGLGLSDIPPSTKINGLSPLSSFIAPAV